MTTRLSYIIEFEDNLTNLNRGADNLVFDNFKIVYAQQGVITDIQLRDATTDDATWTLFVANYVRNIVDQVLAGTI